MRKDKNKTADAMDQAQDLFEEKNLNTEEETGDVLDVNQGSSRFIKTGTTPFHSVRAEKSEQETVTEISNFADRLTTKASAAKIHTGYTGKLNTYDAVHSAGAEGGARMIRTGAEQETDVNDEAADESDGAFLFDADTAEEDVTLFDAAAPETAAETESDDDLEKTRVIAGTPAKVPTARMQTKSDLLREIADSAEDDVRRNPDQLMMDGFNDPEKEKEEARRRKKEAEVLEKELSKSRAKLVNSFKFRGHSEQRPAADEKFSGEARKEDELPGFLQKIADRFAHIPEAFTPVNSREYSDYNERKAVFNSLMDARKTTLARIGIVGLLGLVLLLINAIVHWNAAANEGVFTVMGGSVKLFSAVNLAFLLVTAALMFPELRSGVVAALKIRPKTDTVLTAILCGALVQNICAFGTALLPETDFRLLTPAAILLCIPLLLAKLFFYDNTRHCFKSVATKSDKTYLRKITDEGLTGRLLCDKNTAGSNVVYAGKTRFVSNFLARSANGADDAAPGRRTVFFSVSLSLIGGLLAWILENSFLLGATAFVFCLAIAYPVCGMIASGWMIASENRKLSLKSSFLLRYADAHDFSAVDNIAVDANELLRGTVSDCLTADGVRERQARFVAACVARQAGGMMAATFASDIAAFADKLSPSENTVYEDKLGLSSWVNGCKVLLGTRQLLDNHNVKTPAEEKIRSILSTGELPVFLAMEGHFTAVFAIRYDARADFSAGLGALVERGTNLLLSTTDANITESFAEHLLGLSTDCVRMISASAAQQFAEAKSARSDTEDAGAVFSDSFLSLCRCAAAAIRLERTQQLNQKLCAFGSLAMLAIGLLLTATGVFVRMSSLIPLLLQIIWIAACFAAPFLSTKINLKEKLRPAEKTAGQTPRRQEPAAEAEPETTEPEAADPTGAQPLPAKEPIRENTVYEIEVRTAPRAAVPAEEPAEAPDEEEDPFESLSAFEPRGTRDAGPAQTNAQEEDDFDPADEKPSAFGALTKRLRKKGAPQQLSGTAEKVRGFFSKLVAAPDLDDEADEDYEFYDGAEDEKPNRDRIGRLAASLKSRARGGRTNDADAEEETERPFSLFSKGEERYNPDKSAREIESDYEAKKSMEEQVRKTFTAPEMPEAPLYDLTKKEEPEPEIRAEFVPPHENVDLFDDALFSRFEDDQIFAGLYDDEGRRTR